MPQEKIQEAIALTNEWLSKSSARKHEIQHIFGKLFHISKCVRSACLFVNRKLGILRAVEEGKPSQLDENFKKDLQLFNTFLSHYNSINLMLREKLPNKASEVDT